jgi:3-deoxy-7-phosphoheptulonate synthase
VHVIVTIEEEGTRGCDAVRKSLADWGVQGVLGARIGTTNILLVDASDSELADRVRELSTVSRVVYPLKGSPLTQRAYFPDDTVVRVGNAVIGSSRFTVMAGPCAVESREQLAAVADVAGDGGAEVLRGGAYKPRTSPHAFQGTGREGLKLLAEVSQRTGLPVVSEVVDPRDVEHMSEYVDMFQIGARNAQNFSLLTEVGRTRKPVLLKRGFGCTVDEWLGAAEYVLREGNPDVVLCERGVRTFEPSTRFTLDLAAVSVAKRLTHLPVVVDPSHGSGRRDLVLPMALAAAGAGADGLLIDVHTDGARALCDGDQALTPDEFHTLMKRLRRVVEGLDRTLGEPALAAAGAQ